MKNILGSCLPDVSSKETKVFTSISSTSCGDDTFKSSENTSTTGHTSSKRSPVHSVTIFGRTGHVEKDSVVTAVVDTEGDVTGKSQSGRSARGVSHKESVGADVVLYRESDGIGSGDERLESLRVSFQGARARPTCTGHEKGKAVGISYLSGGKSDEDENEEGMPDLEDGEEDEAATSAKPESNGATAASAHA